MMNSSSMPQFFMRNIAQFTVREEDGVYTAEGVDLAIVTYADNLDDLMKNIEEATSLQFEGEVLRDVYCSQNVFNV
jgi:hypothetical protein